MSYYNYGPPPVPARKSNALWIVLAASLGAIALMFTGCMALVASADPTPPAASGSGTAGPDAEGVAKAGKAMPKIGDKVKDGQFTFVITKKRTSSAYGEGFLTQTAKGVFVILTLKVTNHGGQAQIFDATNQFLYDTEDRKFSAETGAMVEKDVFLESINPGNSVTGRIAFDVPDGTKLTRAELHDSSFSGGVTVSLS